MATKTTKQNAIEFLTVLTGLVETFNPRFCFTIYGLQIWIHGKVIFEGFAVNPKELKKALDELKGELEI